MWYRQRDRRGRREPGGRLESVPTGRRPGRAPWRRGSGGAPAGSATWCCGYCVANRWRRCPVRRAWRSTGSTRGGSGHGWPLGLKARHGEPVAEVLDAAKRHIAVDGDRAAPRAGPPRSSASLWRCGGRDDERDDLRRRGVVSASSGWSGLSARARRSHHHRLGAGPARRGPPPRQSDAQTGGDSDRSRSVPVPRRRPSQGPRPASDPGRDPSRPHAGAARHASLPAPRASGRREDPPIRDSRASGNTGNGTDGNIGAIFRWTPTTTSSDPPQFRLCRGTGNERGGGAVESHAQGASDPRPNLSEPRGRPRRRGRLRGAVQPDLASREAWVSHAEGDPD